MNVRKTRLTVQQFNGIRWHDSKLLGISIYRAGPQELLRISLRLLDEGGDLTPLDIVFVETTYVKLEVDLEAKSQCSDDISDAECLPASEWLRTLSKHNPYDNFQGYLHFRINLIPPGGEINILAKECFFEKSLVT